MKEKLKIDESTSTQPLTEEPLTEENWRDDWRIMGQEGYLLNKRLQHRKFDRSIAVEDYDQCEFCWASFDHDKDNPLTCYYCPEEKVWICEDCFNDFCQFFHWTVEEVPDTDQS